MTGKSRKEQILELLAVDPNDAFLHYGLSMEYASEGNDEEAVRVLGELRLRFPDYVPGYVQAGRALIRLCRDDEARVALTTGIAVAKRQGDDHAAGEMAEFLASLE